MRKLLVRKGVDDDLQVVRVKILDDTKVQRRADVCNFGGVSVGVGWVLVLVLVCTIHNKFLLID
jgi:hypothetical protein